MALGVSQRPNPEDSLENSRDVATLAERNVLSVVLRKCSQKRSKTGFGESGSPQVRFMKPSEIRDISANRSGISRFATTLLFVRLHPFTAVFGFCQRDVTRNVTREGPSTRAALKGSRLTSFSLCRTTGLAAKDDFLRVSVDDQLQDSYREVGGSRSPLVRLRRSCSRSNSRFSASSWSSSSSSS